MFGFEKFSGYNGQYEIVISSPKTVEDARKVVDVLLSGRGVIVKLLDLNPAVVQRITDYLSGACYSLEIDLQTIAPQILIMVSKNAALSGEVDRTNQDEDEKTEK